MDPELTTQAEASDHREWELSDEELDRHALPAACVSGVCQSPASSPASMVEG